ncbi:AAA family ATPase [Novosphingobium piscinae]|uniref:ATP-binding protein n=1 Tax=Novosphingobium piscinae TaxID=1507448 RepID=A0A7X1FZD0_9SPHN|nr:ATP-binding protein [Novosphingobium piscinae]MBC2669152.1 ATP-binding protein [Novosphingobium piscinae]
MTLTVCFHGAESTGKSVLAARLSAARGWPWVPEYGRSYAETHGTAFTIDDLLAMARGQDDARAAALRAQPPVLLLDTDPLMTAAWARMLFGTVPEVLLGYPKADLYLLFAADRPWVEDGTRLFGTAAARARFAATAQDLLVETGVRWAPVSGDWAAREGQVVAAVERALAHPC